MNRLAETIGGIAARYVDRAPKWHAFALLISALFAAVYIFLAAFVIKPHFGYNQMLNVSNYIALAYCLFSFAFGAVLWYLITYRESIAIQRGTGKTK